jgi:hypothetical protein
MEVFTVFLEARRWTVTPAKRTKSAENDDHGQKSAFRKRLILIDQRRGKLRRFWL